MCACVWACAGICTKQIHINVNKEKLTQNTGCMHPYMHACMQTQSHEFMYEWMHTSIHGWMYVCMHACMYEWMHTYIHSWMDVCRYMSVCRTEVKINIGKPQS